MAKGVKAGQAFYQFDAQDNVSGQLKTMSGNITGFGKKLNSVGSNLRNIGAGAVVMGVAVTAGFAHAVSSASDFNETMQKFKIVFGDQADGARKFASTLATEVGRSEGTLLKFMAQAQDTFVPLGFDRETAAELSKTVTSLALDLAAFDNMGDDEAFGRLMSAMVGNTENLTRFGVVANAAAIKAEALSQGFDPKNLTSYQRAMTILQLTIKGTADSQGAALRESTGYASSVKGLKGSMEGLKNAIGGPLLEDATALVRAMTAGVTAATNFAKGNTGLISSLAKTAVGVTAAGGGISALGIAIQTLGFGFGGIGKGIKVFTGLLGVLQGTHAITSSLSIVTKAAAAANIAEAASATTNTAANTALAASKLKVAAANAAVSGSGGGSLIPGGKAGIGKRIPAPKLPNAGAAKGVFASIAAFAAQAGLAIWGSFKLLGSKLAGLFSGFKGLGARAFTALGAAASTGLSVIKVAIGAVVGSVAGLVAALGLLVAGGFWLKFANDLKVATSEAVKLEGQMAKIREESFKAAGQQDSKRDDKGLTSVQAALQNDPSKLKVSAPTPTTDVAAKGPDESIVQGFRAENAELEKQLMVLKYGEQAVARYEMRMKGLTAAQILNRENLKKNITIQEKLNEAREKAQEERQQKKQELDNRREAMAAALMTPAEILAKAIADAKVLFANDPLNLERAIKAAKETFANSDDEGAKKDKELKDFAKGVKESNKTPAQVIAGELGKVNEAVQAGLLTAEEGRQHGENLIEDQLGEKPELESISKSFGAVGSGAAAAAARGGFVVDREDNNEEIKEYNKAQKELLTEIRDELGIKA